MLEACIQDPAWRWTGAEDDKEKCWPFVRHGFDLFGVALPEDVYQTGALFREVPRGTAVQPMDVAYVRHTPWTERHVGIMLNARWMLHFSEPTNGAGKSELTRPPWCFMLKTTYRFKEWMNETHRH